MLNFVYWFHQQPGLRYHLEPELDEIAFKNYPGKPRLEPAVQYNRNVRHTES